MTLATNCVERVCHIHRAAPEQNGAERNHWVLGTPRGPDAEKARSHTTQGGNIRAPASIRRTAHDA